MFHTIDLKELAEKTSPDRAFLSIYLKSPDSHKYIHHRANKIEKMLKSHPDELKHFHEDMKMVHHYFETHKHKQGSLCIFCCWLLDYIEVFPLEQEADDVVRLDNSPYIRPLAELKDEYETFAVVTADNKKTTIHLVTSGTAEDEEKIKGNVKNHVRVGGWSQQRYERRRDKQLKHYAREIVEKLEELDKVDDFRRIILVGSKETMREIHENMPKRLLEKLVAEKALDLSKADKVINEEIFDLFFEEERKSEEELWEKVKAQYLQGELAVVGVEEVLFMAKMGRVEKAIADRDLKHPGTACRNCEALSAEVLEKCPDCGSESVFKVDIVNEIVEMLAKTGAEIDFVDEIDGLKEVGGIAALLRY